MIPAIVAGASAVIAGVGAIVGQEAKNVAAERKLHEPPNPNDPIFGSRTKEKLEQQGYMGR